MAQFQAYIDALDQAAEQVRGGNVLKAYLAWQRYPSEAAFIAKQPTEKDNPGLRMLAENRLYRLLRESVTLLMKTGEELGIAPTSICESARVCEQVCHDFRQWRDPCADTDLWPGCLGSNVYRLPDQERQWVQQSDATLRRLVVAWQQAADKPAADQGKTEGTDELLPEARAILFIQERLKNTGRLPPKTKIAEALGVDRTTLYKWRGFKTAYAKLQQKRQGQPAKGKRDKDGNLEAWRG